MRTTTTLTGALAAVILLLTACGGSDSDASAAGATSGGDCAVGFANPTGQNSYTRAVVEALKIEVENKGCSFTELDAHLDLQQQNSDIQTFITQGVDAIAIYTLDYASQKSVLQQAVDAGIGVFGDDTEVTAIDEAPGAPLTGQVVSARLTEDFIRARFDYLSENLPGGKGEVMYIGFPAGVPALDQDWALTQQIAEEYPDITLVGRTDNPTDDIAGARGPADAALTRHPDLDAFIAYNDPTAIGAAAAAESAGKGDDFLILGAQTQPEGVEALQDGRIDVSWDFEPVDLGQQLAEMILAHIDGDEEAATRTYAGAFTEYSPDNIGDFVSFEDRLAELGGN